MVEHGWTIVKAEPACPRVDDTPTQRVQGVDRDVAGGGAELLADLRAQSAGGFSGEADRQDARGVDASLADQEGDAPGEHGRFSAPWPGDDAERPVVCGNCFHLGRGEAALGHWLRDAARLAFQACHRSKCSSMTSRKGFGHLNLRRTSSSNSARRAAGARFA